MGSLSKACRAAFYERIEAEIPELNQFRGSSHPSGVVPNRKEFSIDALATRLRELRVARAGRLGYEELFAPPLDKARAESTDKKTDKKVVP